MEVALGGVGLEGCVPDGCVQDGGCMVGSVDVVPRHASVEERHEDVLSYEGRKGTSADVAAVECNLEVWLQVRDGVDGPGWNGEGLAVVLVDDVDVLWKVVLDEAHLLDSEGLVDLVSSTVDGVVVDQGRGKSHVVLGGDGVGDCVVVGQGG